jgi:FAD-NAD(P)-binding
MELAIVGLGSWGMSFLERIVTTTRSEPRNVRVHVVEPATPGSGVYDVNQPDYLILNTPCGQVSLYPWEGDGPAPQYACGLYEWVTRTGYRWVGESCRRTPHGRAIDPDDYLPRRLMGEYLQWFYEALVAAAPPCVEVVHHRCEAVDIVAQRGGKERVLLADGTYVDVDHVILTTGHTDNVAAPDVIVDPAYFRRPYPVEQYVELIPAGTDIGIEGLGLVALDVVMALTIGRGGSFEDRGSRMRYRPSGREPGIRLFSRSGFAYCAKAVATVDESDEFVPVLCTDEAIGAIQGGRGTGLPRRQIDLRRDLMPLILGEMQIRYYSQSALLQNGAQAAAELRCLLGRAWHDGSYEATVAGLAERYGMFDPDLHFYGPGEEYVSSKDYESQIYAMVEADLDEALRGGSGPVKSAYEVFRHLRDMMRTVIEYHGLSLESYLDFREHLKTKVNRIVAGPPVIRSKQLLALMDAGIVGVPFGPNPEVEAAGASRFELRSAHLDRPYSEQVDWMIQGHLENPALCRSTSALLTNLWQGFRLKQFCYTDTTVGSVELTEDFHPISLWGRPAPRIWVFGALTEGVRYFTHYVPSPKSRLRAFLDANSCIEQVMG